MNGSITQPCKSSSRAERTRRGQECFSQCYCEKPLATPRPGKEQKLPETLVHGHFDRPAGYSSLCTGSSAYVSACTLRMANDRLLMSSSVAAITTIQVVMQS